MMQAGIRRTLRDVSGRTLGMAPPGWKSIKMADRLLDIAELASRLKIPAKTIRNKLCDGTWPIRPLRIGRALRWRESDVDRVLADLAATGPAEVAGSLKAEMRRKP
jgi:predicted DNA-binding transcriptional regulator AlpA